MGERSRDRERESGSLLPHEPLRSLDEHLTTDVAARSDPVDEYGIESFPSSDPPPWWAGSDDPKDLGR